MAKVKYMEVAVPEKPLTEVVQPTPIDARPSSPTGPVSQFNRMDTPIGAAKPLSTWKRLAIISLFCGAGFALTAGLILGGVVWYKSRPTFPRPWNTAVIVAEGAPGFSVSDDGKMIEFDYVLKNAGRSDYHIDSPSEIQIFGRFKDGSLGEPLTKEYGHLQLPVFIPSGQKASVLLSVNFSNIPTRSTTESDETFHERIRSYLNQGFKNLGSIVIFDSSDRYQIDLPKWLAEAPRQQTP